MFGVEKSTVIDGVEFEDEGESIVVSVRPRKGAKQRCGQCQRRCPRAADADALHVDRHWLAHPHRRGQVRV